jgi:hypothetical protein
MKKEVILFLTSIIIIHASLNSYLGHAQPQYDELRKNAGDKLIIEYNLVKTLNKNNINISYYTNTLNLCVDLLGKAEKYYSVGDDQNAISTLNLVTSLLNNLDNDAKNTLTEYYSKGYITLIFNYVVPITYTIIIITFTIIFWIIYKNYYYTKLMKMKPEVIKNEIK